MWEVELRDTFKQWLCEQDISLKKRIAAYGPGLPRPYADTVKGSRYSNMKELRVQQAGHPIRVFYAFDPVRKAIVLCAGDKTGDKQFYDRMIALADNEFSCHLQEMTED